MKSIKTFVLKALEIFALGGIAAIIPWLENYREDFWWVILIIAVFKAAHSWIKENTVVYERALSPFKK